MRAALLLVILALPSLARAQAAGTVQPDLDGDDKYGTDRYVNADECDAGNSRTIPLEWTVTGGTVTNGVFRIWASNTEAPAAASGGVITCRTTGNSTDNISVGPVGGDVDVKLTGATGNARVSTAEIAEGAGHGSCPSNTEQTVHICVNYHPFQTTGSQDVNPTPAAHAVGTLVFTTRIPAVPTLNSLRAGNERLYANFTAGDGGAVAADRYRLHASPVDPAADGAVVRTSDVDRSGDSIGGLVNLQEYEVTVAALSVAGNPSAYSTGLTGTPLPADDFWDRYQSAGGSEEGGCAAGAAGPLALLGLAAAFALARPRARRRS